MTRYALSTTIPALLVAIMGLMLMSSHSAASARLNARTSMVPGWGDEILSITIRKAPMPIICNLENCATPASKRKSVPTRTVHITKRTWFGRFTDDLNALPPWQQLYSNGCSFGIGAWLYTLIFRYQFGDQWTVTVDRGNPAWMVFADNGDPGRGGGPTCISPRTATILARALDAVFAPKAQIRGSG